METYRVDYQNERTARKNHRDFLTLDGAVKFMKRAGTGYRFLKRQDKVTGAFEPVDSETTEISRASVGPAKPLTSSL